MCSLHILSEWVTMPYKVIHKSLVFVQFFFQFFIYAYMYLHFRINGDKTSIYLDLWDIKGDKSICGEEDGVCFLF